MPSYQTGGLNIRLAVADFDKTVTPHPVTQQNKDSIANADRALKEFTGRSTNIAETPLVDQYGCSLDFLGQHRDMPFLISHAKPPEGKEPPSQANLQDEDSQDSSLTELSSLGSSPFHDVDSASKMDRRPQPGNLPSSSSHGSNHPAIPIGAQAMCLRIQPRKKQLPSPSKPSKIRWGRSDMKIDIFLNGDLCSSSYIPESAFHKKDSVRDTCSGVRVGWVTEKPWILLPTASEISGVANRSNGAPLPSRNVRTRWEDVSKALQLTANSYTRAEGMELSHTSDYLSSLAKYQMPVALLEMLDPGNPRYAIIDVVVIAGKGRKEHASAPYLMSPTPLKLDRARDPSPTRPAQEPDALEPNKRARIAHPTRSAADSEILPQGFPLEFKRRSSAGTVTPTPDINRNRVVTSIPKVTRSKKDAFAVPGPLVVEAIDTAPISKVMPPLLPAPAIQPKRGRMIYHDVIDTRQTREEELKEIVDQAASDAERFMTRSRKLADPLGTPGLLANNISTAPTTTGTSTQIASRTPSPSKILTLKYASPAQGQPAPATTRTPTSVLPTLAIPPRKRKYHTSFSSSSSSLSSSPDQPLAQLRPRTSLTLDIPSPPLLAPPILTPTPTPNPAAAPPPTTATAAAIPIFPPTSTTAAQTARTKRTRTVYQQAKPFEIPPLSRDSVVSYPEGGVVRQVRSERGGWFREEGVLVGCRFVVG
ncbi:MAG: hypothetical protein Q9168_003897 [Polycauliona sp. 1 TL-2023]